MDLPSFDLQEVKKVIEAALLTANEPLPISDLKKLFDEDLGNDMLRNILAELAQDWAQRSVELVSVASGWRCESFSVAFAENSNSANLPMLPPRCRSSSMNAEIITYSKYYRFNFVSLMTMAVLNVVLNLLFVPKGDLGWGVKGLGWGITGSALATLISVTVVNLWRLIFIYQKYKIQPLTIKMLWVVLISISTWFLASRTPSVSNPFLNILIKGSTITALYAFALIYFKISEDVQQVYEKMKMKLF